MNNCGTCKYFGELIELPNRTNNTYHQCDVIKHDDEFKSIPNQQAIVQDGSGYFAVFCVESDFGCVKHEPE